MGSQNAADEAAIRKLVDAQKKAMHDKNAAEAVTQFATDAVVFDLAPPLRSVYGGNADKVQEWMNTWDGPIDTETRELKIRISGDVACWYGYSRLSGRPKESPQGVNFWMRMTLLLERVNGVWKVVHSHTSVPFYMDGSLRPAFDLQP
ncbi:MAG TPA: nuclear transport factor 2 family protein [Acidobacteriaceae bacterium]|jgi:ketosteroid isomerase-like protein